jgi:hypothetical protein
MNGIRYEPLINGVQHAWSNIVVQLGIPPVTGITAIEYTAEQVQDDIMGAGQETIGVGYGNITKSGSITLYRDEVEAIRSSSPTGFLFDIVPFDIIVSFLPIGGQKKVTHKLLQCTIKNDGVSSNQGDTSNTIQLTLRIGKLDMGKGILR